LKEGRWGARCLICTTVHNDAGLNHANLPQLSAEPDINQLIYRTAHLPEYGSIPAEVITTFRVDLPVNELPNQSTACDRQRASSRYPNLKDGDDDS
jgi:hypothetical protein